jgi:hypothetical protein
MAAQINVPTGSIDLRWEVHKAGRGNDPERVGPGSDRVQKATMTGDLYNAACADDTGGKKPGMWMPSV